MNKIKQLREAAGLTQAELAKRVGVVTSAVGRWEIGIANPTWDKAPLLAQALGCSIEELFAADAVSAPAPASKG